MLFKHKKWRQRRRCAGAVLVLSMTVWLVTSVSAEEECAMDFFSQKTCRLFDTMDWSWDARQSREFQKSAEGADLWNSDSGLSGSQIWYRNPLDGNWTTITLGRGETLRNWAIHGFRCVTDLFGNVFCS